MALIVSSVCWIKRGKLSPFPRSEVREEAEKAIKAEEQQHQEKKEEEMEVTSAASTTETTTTTTTTITPAIDPIISQYHLETYDEDPEPLMAGTFYENPEQDPNLADMEDDSDVEETALLADDLFILAGTTDAEDEISHLDMHIYEERDSNMFAHHDYLLAAFPLSVAFVEKAPGMTSGTNSGCFAAVGSFDTAIEIWDLNVIDAIEPVGMLGGVIEGTTAKRGTGNKKRKQKALKPGSHTDSVLSLSANKARTELLASGSADKTVKLWDLTRAEGEPIHTFRHHNDKVQAIEWCPLEPSILLTVGFDKRACVIDVRSGDNSVALEWKLPSDPESALWIPNSNYRFIVSNEDGHCRCFEASQKTSHSAPLWTIAAHNKPCSALAINAKIPGLLVTGSLDRHVKLWSISGTPSCIYSRDTTSSVFSAAFSEDSEFLLALGTSSGVRIWDTSDLTAVRRAFGGNSNSTAAATTTTSNSAEVENETPKEISPPGQGPAAEKKKAEKAKKKQQEEEQEIQAQPRQPPTNARGSRRMRFAKPKFTHKKL